MVTRTIKGKAAIGGLATGLDTTSIINSLLAVQQQQITTLQANETTIKDQQAAFQSIGAKLQVFEANITQLSKAQNSVFDGKLATSSDQTLLTAAASAGATPGVYSLQVNRLAQANQIASQGFDGANSAITQGTVQTGVASAATTTITI